MINVFFTLKSDCQKINEQESEAAAVGPDSEIDPYDATLVPLADLPQFLSDLPEFSERVALAISWDELHINKVRLKSARRRLLMRALEKIQPKSLRHQMYCVSNAY